MRAFVRVGLALASPLLACTLTACGSDDASANPNDTDASAPRDAAADVALDSMQDTSIPVDATHDAAIDAPRDSGTTDATLHDAATSPCPDDSALVASDAGSVCVDLYEAALVEQRADGTESAWPWYTPVDDIDASALRAVPAKGIFPQGYISQEQAAAACERSSKRLCTEAEWTAACRGQPTHDYVYPYGDTYESGRCNEGHESPIILLYGPNADFSSEELNDPRCDQEDGGLAHGGAYSECVSSYGAFDMHGNLHEWISDVSEDGHGAFLGGYFVDAKINGPGCEYKTTAHATTYHDYSTGFRCCADPKMP